MKRILTSRNHRYIAIVGISLIAIVLVVVMVACGGPGEQEEEEEETYDLTIASTAGGSVTTPEEGTATYGEGTVVDLVAAPDAGYGFVNWTGDVATIDDADAAATTITMNGDYSVTANFAEVPPPTFTIQWFDPEKQGTYALGDLVEVLVILTNEGQWPITVNRRFAVNERSDVEADLGEVYFIIRDSANNPLPFLARVRVSYPDAEDFATLEADGLAVWGAELTLFYDLASPGLYTVQAVYRSELVPAGIEAWVGTLTSNTLTLTIE